MVGNTKCTSNENDTYRSGKEILRKAGAHATPSDKTVGVATEYHLLITDQLAAALYSATDPSRW